MAWSLYHMSLCFIESSLQGEIVLSQIWTRLVSIRHIRRGRKEWRNFNHWREHTQSAYVSIRQHTSHTSRKEGVKKFWSLRRAYVVCIRLHTSAYVCIRLHTSVYVEEGTFPWHMPLSRLANHFVCWRMLTYANVCRRMQKYAVIAGSPLKRNSAPLQLITFPWHMLLSRLANHFVCMCYVCVLIF